MVQSKSKSETPRKSGERPGKGWLSRAAMAEVLGVSEVQFDRKYLPLAPADAVYRDHRRTWIHGRKLIDALIAAEVAKVKPAPDADPMLAAGDSPNLERYRSARAALAELELQERQGTHVSLAELDAEITRFASAIRRVGEVLQRRWGNDASDALNQGLDGALAQFQNRINHGNHHHQQDE